MSAPLELEVTLGTPAVPTGKEPESPVYARLRLKPRPELAARPKLDLCFILDASASMHRFQLDPEQRQRWQQIAEQRGEISRQIADGRTGMVWTGRTLRELQQVVSTPMLSALRGVWKTLEGLAPDDAVSVLAFADRAAVVYEDAGAAENGSRLSAARAALGRLGSGVDESGLGRGTRLAGALDHVLRRAEGPTGPVLRRAVLISDGIIEDTETCRPLLDRAVEAGLVISAIGVGDDFDEEYLMAAADLTRGNYYYAAAAPEVEQAILSELKLFDRVSGRRGMLRIQPESGTILRDVYPVAPSLSEFQTVWVENGAWRFRIGDLSAEQALDFLVELAPPAHPSGSVPVGAVHVEAQSPAAAEGWVLEAPIRLYYSDDPMLLQARDDEVLDAVRRLEVYVEERRSALAAQRGDREASTRHLRAATKLLRGMGREDLAAEMDAAASETEAGTRNLTRTKRVKAETRRLGSD